MPTIEDVAEMAGVSVATVSRVLNNSYKVSREKHDRVMEAVKALNYQPNAMGRNLRLSETKIVLVVCSVVIRDVINGIQDVAKSLGYDVILSYNGNKAGGMDSIKFLKNRLVDGVIFSSVNFKSQELYNISAEYPVVQCCEYVNIPNSYLVSVDDEKAAYDMVVHLISQGRKRIGFITYEGPNNSLNFPHEREKGYRRALSDYGIPYDPKLKIVADYGYEGGCRAAGEFMKLSNKPDAVFSIQDMFAVGCLNTLKSNGIQIPDDIAVAGFDHWEIADMCEPKLSTVVQPFYDIGCETMRMMAAVLKGEVTTGRQIFINHQLLIRGSTVKGK